MKKEKLSLKGVKNTLSRKEMKKITAGSGPCLAQGVSCNPGQFPPFEQCCPGLTCKDTGPLGGHECL